MIISFQEQDLKKELHEAQIKKLKAGDVLLRENAYVQAIPILTTGLLSVFRTDEDGKEILLYYIRPGESCIMSFLAGVNHDTSKVRAIADEDSELLMIPVDKVSKWITLYPEWSEYIFKLYQQRFEELLQVVNSLVFQKMDERLWNHLQKKTELSGQKDLSITHQQIADELGTSREVISRLLKELEKNGLISLGRNKIQVK